MGMIDNLIAMRILYKLVTPFDQSDAFKLGIIDAQGKLLKKPAALVTSEEKDAYDMLDRLVFNLKRLLSKLPGGDSKLKNIAAAYFLVKEHIENEDVTVEQLEEELVELSNIWLLEETMEIMDFLALHEEGEGLGGGVASNIPVNVTGTATATDEPVVKKKKPKLVTRSII